ncbi:MAG: T9SS type A sorting domain-containing protein [bacterium]|nr:T9SS type A sorting domain-containing protein [bacterium]
MKPLYLLIALFVSPLLLTAQSEWDTIAPLPNNLVTDHSYAFALDGKGYLVAGADEFSYLDIFFQYDPEADTWTELDDFPGGFRGFGIGDTWDGKAYFGFGFNGSSYMRDLWVFDPQTGEWTELASCPCQARIHPAFIAHNDKIFVGMGGSANGNLRDWWEYDMATDSWSQKPSFPGARRHHPFQFGLGEYIYTGFGHGDNFISNQWYRYDPATEEWTEVATLPAEGRVAGTQFSYNGKGYVLSGDGGDHTSMEEGEFWSYDPELDLWEELPPHPGVSRWAPASFLLDGWVYLLGGPSNVNGTLNYAPSNNYRYQLEEISSSPGELVKQPALFEAFPNPFASQVQLNWHNSETEGLVRVLNNQGQEVFRSKELLPSLTLDFLPAGIYTIEATIGPERTVKRITKQ